MNKSIAVPSWDDIVKLSEEIDPVQKDWLGDEPKVKPTDEFQTPPWLFAQLTAKYSFRVDIAARQANALCKYYCTDFLRYGLEDFDGLMSCYCNPPYSRCEEWVVKCYEESKKGHQIVMLIPASTDTNYWHEIVFKNAKEIWFLHGRIAFWMNDKPYTIDGRPSAGRDSIAVVVLEEPRPRKYKDNIMGEWLKSLEQFMQIKELPREPIIKAVDLSPQTKLPFEGT